MNERDTIQAIAELWVTMGGDSEGIAWCWGDVREAVKELERNKTEEEDEMEKEE